MADAASRVGVGDVDELADGVLAVAGRRWPGRARRSRRPCRRSRGSGSRCRRRSSRRRDRRSGSRRRRAGKAVRTASSLRRSSWTPRPWLPSSGLTTHGKPIRCAASTAASSVSTTLLFGDRQSGRVEEAVRQALVARDVDGDARRSSRSSSPGSAAGGRPGRAGRASGGRAGCTGCRGWLPRRGSPGSTGPEGRRSASRMRRSSSAMKSSWRSLVARRDEVVDERDRDLAGLDADGLLAVLVDDVVAAVLAGACGSCRGGRRCRRGSGARGRCARRCGRPTCPRAAG